MHNSGESDNIIKFIQSKIFSETIFDRHIAFVGMMAISVICLIKAHNNNATLIMAICIGVLLVFNFFVAKKRTKRSFILYGAINYIIIVLLVDGISINLQKPSIQLKLSSLYVCLIIVIAICTVIVTQKKIQNNCYFRYWDSEKENGLALSGCFIFAIIGYKIAGNFSDGAVYVVLTCLLTVMLKNSIEDLIRAYYVKKYNLDMYVLIKG